MHRGLPVFCVLATLSFVVPSFPAAQPVPSASPASALWRLPNVDLVGFGRSGLPVTRTLDTRTRNSLSRLDLREPATGKVTASADLPGASARAFPLAFTPDLKTLAWMDTDQLTVKTPNRRWTARTPGLKGSRELLLSPDGTTLAVANDAGYVQLWDTGTAARRTTLMLRARPDQLRFSPDGQTLAINERFPVKGETTLSLWTPRGSLIGRVLGVNGVSRGAFEFSADGQEMLVDQPGSVLGWINLQTGSVRPGSVRRWQPRQAPCNRTQVCRYALHATLNAARDRALVWTNDGAAMLYDAGRGTRLKALPAVLNRSILSPDGRWVYRSGYDLDRGESALQIWKLP